MYVVVWKSPKMDELTFLTKALLNTEIRDEKFRLLLKACNDQVVFACKAENNIKDVVSSVNGRLGDLRLRPSGILLLKILLEQCPDTVFVENSHSWMLHCMKAVANQQETDEACNALRMLIKMSHNFQELTRMVSEEVIPRLLINLVRIHGSVAALQCLEVMLHHYPGPCKAKATTVKDYLLQFVDERNRVLVEHASRCMCYLPLLSTGDSEGTWMNTQIELCATANSLMYELFERVNEVAVPSVLTALPPGYKKLVMNHKTDNPTSALHHIATRIINISTFIEGMLLGDLSNVKAVRADLLIALACRALSINSKMVSRGKSMDNVALVCVLPDIHISAFSLLQTLVSCCPGGLVKYGPLFCKLVVQTLKWTSVPCEYGMERPYRYLREATYKFLKSWVTRAKAASCVELVGEQLVAEMLKEVSQKKAAVTLQFQEKGKTTSSQELLPQIREQLADSKANAGPCEAALRALCSIIQSSGSLLGPSLHMRLQETVASILLEIQRSSGPEGMPVPYCVTGCRVQLYNLLLALTVHPHPRWPPPTQFALELFPKGQHDCALEVAGVCTLATACIRQMVHPSQSSHQFPMTVEEMRASVGLPNLEPVQGLKLNMQNGQDKAMEIGAAVEGSKISVPQKPQHRPVFENSVEEMVVTQLNSDKPSKRKPCVSVIERNGIERSPTTSNSFQLKKKRKLNSFGNDGHNSSFVKPSIKLQHLQFSVEELVTSTDKKTNRNSGQEWDVTDVTKKKKRKKTAKSTEGLESPLGRKHCQDSSVNESERDKNRKLDGSPSKSNDCRKSVVGNANDVTLDSNGEALNDTAVKETISDEACVIINVKAKMKTNVDVENKTLNETKPKEDTSCTREIDMDIEEHQKEKEKEITETFIRQINEKDNRKDIGVLEIDKEDQDEIKIVNAQEKSLAGARMETEDEKLCSAAKASGSSPDKSICHSQKVDHLFNSSPSKIKTPEKNTSTTTKPERATNSKSEEVPTPKKAFPVVELISSDSDSEVQKKTSYRRITRSLSKRTSTPYRYSEPDVDIEELPSSQEISIEMLSEISRVEEECVSSSTNRNVEIEDSDGSAPLFLRIDSDRESVEIHDATSDHAPITDVKGTDKKEKGETIDLAEVTTVASNSPSTRTLKDSVASDREMEEGSQGMEAVVDSPDVAVEETPSSDKENAAKKLPTESGNGSESESAEEDILKTFVDVVSPKSA